MTREPTLTTLQREEQLARARLARFRARLYARPHPSPMSGSQRLAELERSWRAASARLLRARKELHHH